jgi:hypothetical protein
MNPQTNNQQDKTITAEEAMAMNRKMRRILGKKNGVKITGSNTAHIKNKPYALTTFTGEKI